MRRTRLHKLRASIVVVAAMTVGCQSSATSPATRTGAKASPAVTASTASPAPTSGITATRNSTPRSTASPSRAPQPSRTRSANPSTQAQIQLAMRPNPPLAGSEATLTVTVTGLTYWTYPSRVAWGDGTTSTAPANDACPPTTATPHTERYPMKHVWGAPGRYLVVVTISDTGCSASHPDQRKTLAVNVFSP